MTIDIAPRDVLTRDEAEARAARVTDVEYRLDLDLQAHQPAYRGSVHISFVASGTDELFLDFRGRSIERMEVDGEPVTPERTPYRLTVPRPRRPGARTELLIEYTNDYDKDGDGFHQFVDPEDGAEYVYSNFEPYDAHRLFPCFDQPDIKASYEVSVAAPASWEVVANSRETAAEELPDGRVRRRFEKTERFSTYLMAVVAGEYHAARSSTGHPDGRPLPAGAREVPGSRPGLRADRAGHGLLRRAVRPPVPVHEVRPDLRAGVQLRSDGERRRRDAQRALHLPRPADEQRPADEGGGDPPRARAHVVRQPGHDALVGRPVAQRELRDLRLVPGHR